MNRKNLLILFFLIVLVIIILVLLNFFLPNILETLNKNSNIPESNKITVAPELVEQENNIYAVDINFRTQDDSGEINKISAVSFSLTYPRDPNNQVEVVTVEGEKTDTVAAGEEISSNPDWRIPINSVVNNNGGVTIDFAAVNVSPEGFSSVNGTTLATIYFKAKEPLQEDTFILNFNSDNTIILTKTSPTKNIRGESDLYYSVGE